MSNVLTNFLKYFCYTKCVLFISMHLFDHFTLAKILEFIFIQTCIISQHILYIKKNLIFNICVKSEIIQYKLKKWN